MQLFKGQITDLINIKHVVLYFIAGHFCIYFAPRVSFNDRRVVQGVQLSTSIFNRFLGNNVADSQKQGSELKQKTISKLVLIIIAITAMGLPLSIYAWSNTGFHNLYLVHFVFIAVAISFYFRSSTKTVALDTMLVVMFLSFILLIGAYEYGFSSGLLALLITAIAVIAVMQSTKASILVAVVMLSVLTAILLFLTNKTYIPLGNEMEPQILITASLFSSFSVFISFTIIAILLIDSRNSLHSSLTELDEQAKRVDYLANHDELTGLSSARLAQEQLELTLKMAKRHEFKAAILHIDIDKFRLINDALGHDAGDYALKEVAKRIRELIRDTDIACRQGGDEFLVILHYPVSLEACDVICNRLIAAFDQRVPYTDHEIKINLSIGIAIYPDHGLTQFELRTKAEKAMHKSKSDQKHNYTFAD